MEIVIIVLFVLAIVLIVASLFMKDRTKDLENQLDGFTMTFMQEIYQLKKKITILEEELLSGSEDTFLNQTMKKNTTSGLINEVASYYEAGYSIEKIAELTTLSENEVLGLIASYQRKDGQ
ncbi:hypothetical protein BTR23_21470 [Alkalihalophilus pseudofirmus]|uniref:hypothetical protein n=1 Tax=Alkalihalobacterium alkalinitrilicum TaxID=427920 RepID=UPI00094D9933|nr:hypothetical protein [Alkalihalobacterium alkalinitrilicum]OLO26945.1 hypothetical protein BTR23_21470 [Alkalihalophilus pseudofirmus]